MILSSVSNIPLRSPSPVARGERQAVLAPVVVLFGGLAVIDAVTAATAGVGVFVIVVRHAVSSLLSDDSFARVAAGPEIQRYTLLTVAVVTSCE